MVVSLQIPIDTAVQVIGDPANFLLLVGGMLMGLFMGVIPGLGGTVALALLIPITFGMDPLVAFMILAAAKGGVNFGGSLSSILINTPGSAVNAATVLDGYRMTQNGESGRAIGASATASGLGAIFGIIVVAISIPLMTPILLAFGSPEIFWLAIWGLTVIAVVVRGKTLSGLVSAIFGILFALHGVSYLTATPRWTYGFTFLRDGFKLIPALVGLFAIAEMLRLLSKGGTISEQQYGEIKGKQWQGMRDVFIHKGVFLRSSIIGAIIGVIPGVGGSAANYIAYFQAVQTSSDPESYGTGDVRGVIAPEASNDAKDGTALLPTLGFGIPGDAAMAVLLGAFILHGITPGPLLIQNNPDIVVIIVVSLLISNFLTSITGLLIADQLARITRIDVNYLAPAIIAISFFGSYALNYNIFDMFITLLFGLLGFSMIIVGMSRVPMILGLVLAPIIQETFFRSLEISSGDYMIFISSHIAIFLILLTVLSLLIPLVRDRIEVKQIVEWYS